MMWRASWNFRRPSRSRKHNNQKCVQIFNFINHFLSFFKSDHTNKLPVTEKVYKEIISLPILTCAVPELGKFVEDVNVKLDDVVVNVLDSAAPDVVCFQGVVHMADKRMASACKERGIPIIGTGGVTHWEDAAEFILAGATCVGIGTASYINPTISTRISAQLASWVHKQNKPLSSLVGSLGLTQPT